MIVFTINIYINIIKFDHFVENLKERKKNKYNKLIVQFFSFYFINFPFVYHL